MVVAVQSMISVSGWRKNVPVLIPVMTNGTWDGPLNHVEDVVVIVVDSRYWSCHYDGILTFPATMDGSPWHCFYYHSMRQKSSGWIVSFDTIDPTEFDYCFATATPNCSASAVVVVEPIPVLEPKVAAPYSS
jgi:hypothetical protein